MNNSRSKLLIPHFKYSALALAIAASMPAWSANSKDVKELPTAQAQTQAEESYKVERMSSHKYSQPLAETPKTITVINKSVMKDRGITTLRDSLRGVSGISMAAGEGGTPTGDAVTIRGFSARTDIFTDGIRDIAGYSRDVYNTEAIEITKGPGSSVSGRGSVGGSINLSRKKARLDNFTDIGVLAGSESNYRVTIDSNITVGDTTALRINALTTDGDVAGRDEVENSMGAIAVSLATGLGTDTRITLSAEAQDQNRLPDYGLPWVSSRQDYTSASGLSAFVGGPPPVSFDNFYGNVFRDFEEIQATSLTGLFEKDLSEDALLFVQMRYGSVERNSITTAPRFVLDDTNGNLAGAAGIRLNDEKTRDQENTMAALQAAYIASSGNHDFSIGAEYYLEKEDRHILSDNGTDNLLALANDFINPNPRIPFTGSYTRTGVVNTAESTTMAIYAFDTYTLSEQWALNAGLRFENYESDTFTVPRGQTTPVTLTRDDNMLSWNVGAVYSIQDNGNVYFSVGKSFNPAAEDLTANSRGNEIDLNPEESIGFELGTKWELFDERLLASAALFRTDKTNARSDDPFDGDGTDNRADTLNGEQRVEGIEFSAFGQISDQLAITASYTLQDSEVLTATGEDADQQGNALARTPESSLSVWASYDPTEKLSVGLGYEYVDERFNSTRTSRVTAPDYELIDIMVSYQLSDDLLLQLNGNNIADERYADLVGGGHFVPGAGRSVNLSAYYSF